jgi:hypothetical protein
MPKDVDWKDLVEFQGIDLNDSFILNWSREEHEIVFSLEASVWPESIYYRAPENNEYTCYRKATLRFSGVSSCVGLLATSEVKPTIDPDGSIDFGNIDTFNQIQDGFSLTGEFGNVIIICDEMHFEILK